MTLPTVTILCSNYNSSRWIEGYCQSVNDQLLNSFNIVFVDAASTDDSLEKFKSFGFRDGIGVEILECKERISVFSAWNKAIDISDSDYCINFNTDDRLYPAALHTMLLYAKSFPDTDVIYSRSYIVGDPDHEKIINSYDFPEYTHEKLLQQCIFGPFPLFKRSTIVKAGLFDQDYTIAGDYEMWLRLSKKGCNFKKIPETIGSYFMNPAGLSTDKSAEKERYGQADRARNKHR